PCSWKARISACFDGEGSWWERWRCRRHADQCAACCAWLRQVESGCQAMRAGIGAAADPAFVNSVMSAVYALPVPYPAAARAVPASGSRDWIRPALAGSLVAASLGLLFPLLVARRGADPALSCQSNLRQIGRALTVYAQDYDERLPPGETWPAA